MVCGTPICRRGQPRCCARRSAPPPRCDTSLAADPRACTAPRADRRTAGSARRRGARARAARGRGDQAPRAAASRASAGARDRRRGCACFDARGPAAGLCCDVRCAEAAARSSLPARILPCARPRSVRTLRGSVSARWSLPAQPGSRASSGVRHWRRAAAGLCCDVRCVGAAGSGAHTSMRASPAGAHFAAMRAIPAGRYRRNALDARASRRLVDATSDRHSLRCSIDVGSRPQRMRPQPSPRSLHVASRGETTPEHHARRRSDALSPGSGCAEPR